MNRKTELLEGETYHVYNRGAHKQAIFTHPIDYARFQLLLYLGNSTERIHLGNLLTKYKGATFINIYDEVELSKEQRPVDVLAYTLMPNHFHLILRQKQPDGITNFLRKISTAYSMYFNKKYEHSGTLLQGAFKSKHAETDKYLRWLFAYVYSNPLEMGKEISKYPHSSFIDVCATKSRPEAKIICWDAVREMGDDHPREVNNIKQIIKVAPL